MNISEVQSEIRRLKKENDICILAHSYQTHDIIEIADFTGDSYALSKLAKTTENKTVIMCGVRFMAETVKMLSPEKKVILSSPTAGCPMAEQFDIDAVNRIKQQHPGITVAAYINTTARLKTVCDVCVTSSSALKIISALDSKDILFIPDINLGTYIKNKLPEKNIMLLDGGCPVHSSIDVSEAIEKKKAHPDALLLVHPECRPEISEIADYVGSTSGIMDFAKNSSSREFIIGTETSIVAHLQYECPDKRFYAMSDALVCKDMKANTLVDVLNCCKGVGGEEIIMDSDTIEKAVKCIDAMISLGG